MEFSGGEGDRNRSGGASAPLPMFESQPTATTDESESGTAARNGSKSGRRGIGMRGVRRKKEGSVEGGKEGEEEEEEKDTKRLLHLNRNNEGAYETRLPNSDDLRNYAYEGEGSTPGSLSSCCSGTLDFFPHL